MFFQYHERVVTIPLPLKPIIEMNNQRFRRGTLELNPDLNRLSKMSFASQTHSKQNDIESNDGSEISDDDDHRALPSYVLPSMNQRSL